MVGGGVGGGREEGVVDSLEGGDRARGGLRGVEPRGACFVLTACLWGLVCSLVGVFRGASRSAVRSSRCLLRAIGRARSGIKVLIALTPYI